MSETVELWRTEFRARAYRDQTGAWREGYVVFERVEAEDSGERFDVNDGYSLHKAHGRIYISDGGQRFKVWTETAAEPTLCLRSNQISFRGTGSCVHGPQSAT